MEKIGTVASYLMVPAGASTMIPVCLGSLFDDAARLRDLGMMGGMSVVIIALCGVVVVGYKYAAKQTEKRIEDLKASAAAQRLEQKDQIEELMKVLRENSSIIASARETINAHTLAVQAMTRHCTEKNGATHIP